ncbi:hypothetical protein, conserved [Angomonas deanei]|uniref:C3H1-type domain-containing protein n=1 Tax=Angomonas deanei TaxID=59799 RepID=A0A7G2CH01_9TRYP|nr:hypothetical protein, conserved [Angomonas deanei]
MNNSTAVDANLDNDSSPLDFLVPVSGGNELMNAVFLPEGLILRHSLHTRWTTRDMYPTLPNGVVFSIALPNTATPVEDFDSGVIFVTKGAEEYYNQVVSKEPTTVTMQHCAHYSKNGVCCYGNECQFVHVVHYTHKSRFDLDNSESDTDGASLGSSTTSDARKSNRGKRNKENPLSMLGGKSGKKSDSCNHSRTSSQGSGINTNVVPSPNGTPGTVFVPTGWPSQPNNNMGNVMPFNNNVQPFVNTGNPFVMMPTGTNPQMIFMPQQNPSQPPVYLMPFSYPNQ